MRAKTSLALLLSSAAIVSLTLTGCSSAAPAASSNGTIRVVASTDVWGDIAKQIGGDRVTVTSIIDNPSQDPHSYQGDAQVQLALSKANVVIENGGGYDDFMATLLSGVSNSSATVLNAADLSKRNQHPSSGEFNEHLWYDCPTVGKVASAITAELSTRSAKNSGYFEANLTTFTAALKVLEGDEAALKAKYSGEGAAITEPVPAYLLEASGLTIKTPQKFSAAIENGTDVSPLVLKQTLDQFSSRAVKVLAYNEQTTGPETTQVLAAAKSAGIPVVGVRETLPQGQDYLAWMTSDLAQLATALAKD